MGLFDFFKKKAVPQNQPVDKNQSNDAVLDDIDAYTTFNRSRDNKLLEWSVMAAKAPTIDEEIRFLSKTIEYYYEYKKESASLGGVYYENFSKMHMHCHNSKNSDFEFVVPYEERLKYIHENYDALIKDEEEKLANEAKKQNLLENIDVETDLKNIIYNNPGVLQSELYKNFDPLLKDVISEILYYWAKEGKVNREKNGRSYKLFWIH